MAYENKPSPNSDLPISWFWRACIRTLDGREVVSNLSMHLNKWQYFCFILRINFGVLIYICTGVTRHTYFKFVIQNFYAQFCQYLLNIAQFIYNLCIAKLWLCTKHYFYVVLVCTMYNVQLWHLTHNFINFGQPIEKPSYRFWTIAQS